MHKNHYDKTSILYNVEPKFLKMKKDSLFKCSQALIVKVEASFIVCEDYIQAGEFIIILFYSDDPDSVSLYRANGGAPIAERIKMQHDFLLANTSYDDYKKSKQS